MFQLISLGNDQFAVRIRSLTIVGTFAEAKSYLIEYEGVAEDSIKAALDEMQKRNHNVADFGVFGDFIFTRAELISIAIDDTEQSAA